MQPMQVTEAVSLGTRPSVCKGLVPTTNKQFVFNCQEFPELNLEIGYNYSHTFHSQHVQGQSNEL